jgi:hypothetical protein
MTRCPKCRKTSITIFEVFEVHSAIYMEADKCVDVNGHYDTNSTNKFRATCEGCGYSWRPRYKTGHDAVEAAELFESTM